MGSFPNRNGPKLSDAGKFAAEHGVSTKKVQLAGGAEKLRKLDPEVRALLLAPQKRNKFPGLGGRRRIVPDLAISDACQVWRDHKNCGLVSCSCKCHGRA